ncbi:MAG TPA: hypothetical protein PLN19_01075 [Methanothrix sp.]|nr:hypothetical protein [Methanothrix sp.]HPC88775.1 hypothetical protein [Methanothrix sp.]HQE86841.1 hypothetical protein [Methanothrix sp.]HRS84641.1 hypothetical protein [Methanothrix sp.]HRT16624.1 hypothetical protein [Methanothrix sp.]
MPSAPPGCSAGRLCGGGVIRGPSYWAVAYLFLKQAKWVDAATYLDRPVLPPSFFYQHGPCSRPPAMAQRLVD